MRNFFFMITLLMGFSSFGQDPQTNAPHIIYPLLDEFIKEGFNRNFRTHTRNLRTIDYIMITFIVDQEPQLFEREYGDNISFRVYQYWKQGYNETHSIIAINKIWVNNFYLMRRMLFKGIGLAYGVKECHEDCRHIMSKRDVTDPVLLFYDAVQEEWQKELSIFYRELSRV